MKRLLSIIIFAFLAVACQQKIKQSESLSSDSTAISTEVKENSNQLTEQQKAEGWKLLFDGKTMTGWSVFKNKENDSWEVIDGTLHCKPFVENGTNKRSDLRTNDLYEDFELAFDWKVAAQSNSGVIYRSTEEFDEPYASGPEYQVIDDAEYPGDLKDVQLSGSAYDMYAPTAPVVKPAGEWNAGKIIVKANHVEHWLNGTKVVEYDFHSEDWKKHLAASKWKDFPGYGLATKGYIDLQDHRNEVWFRNIVIR